MITLKLVDPRGKPTNHNLKNVILAMYDRTFYIQVICKYSYLKSVFLTKNMSKLSFKMHSFYNSWTVNDICKSITSIILTVLQIMGKLRNPTLA